MTIRDKNLINNFLDLMGINKETSQRENNIMTNLDKLMEYLPKEKKIEIIKLQREIFETLDLVKWEYMDYGAKVNEVIDNFNLEWTPETVKEINEKAREEKMI